MNSIKYIESTKRKEENSKFILKKFLKFLSK